jgi:glycosyltransferase involved in cell wall biosynthesis
MRILQILSQLELTGAERMACDLTAELIRRGHQALVVSDTINIPWNCPFFPMPLNKRSYPQRIASIRRLNALVRSFRPRILHAHSRGASWAASFSSAITGIPLVVSVHQLLPGGFSKRLIPALGIKTLAICEQVAEHLRKHFPTRPGQVEILRNALDLRLYAPKPRNKTTRPRVKRIGVLGRQSGPKGEATRWFIARVFPKIVAGDGRVELHIAGRENSLVRREAELGNRRLGKKLVFLDGMVRDVPAFISSCDLVVAAGRSALEVMACGRPLLALGERGCLGMLEETNVVRGEETSFGDCLEREDFDAPGAIDGAIRTLSDDRYWARLAHFGRFAVEKEHDICRTVDRLEEIYHQLLTGKSGDGR